MIEIYKDIKGYENIYQVSNLGNVKSLVSNKQKFKSNHSQGYLRVSLWKNNKGKDHYIHRLVVQSFIGTIPKDKQVNHIDGNKHNNRIDNLEIVTPKENIHHAIKTGLTKSPLGIVNKTSKSGFANISPKFVKGKFMWCLCLRLKNKRYDRTSTNIYELICLYNQIVRENNLDEKLLHKLNANDIKRYGTGLVCILD